jgi:hypothetical protein
MSLLSYANIKISDPSQDMILETLEILCKISVVHVSAGYIHEKGIFSDILRILNFGTDCTTGCKQCDLTINAVMKSFDLVSCICESVKESKIVFGELGVVELAISGLSYVFLFC